MSKYEVGDEVDLRVRVVGLSDMVACQIKGAEPNGIFTVFPSSLDAGKRVPRPIKVGDRVSDGMIHSWRVLGIDGGTAWCKHPESTAGWLFDVAELERVS